LARGAARWSEGTQALGSRKIGDAFKTALFASCDIPVRRERSARSREGPVVRILLPPPASSRIGSLTTCARQAAISACDDQYLLVLVLNGITTAGYSEPWLLRVVVG
jgi:hypothetical protein